MTAPAELIVTNGKIVPVDAGFSLHKAIAVRDGRVQALGSVAEIDALKTADTRVIDAGGRTVIPGLIDGHSHMDREGLKNVFPSLAGCKSIQDVLDRVSDLVKQAGPGEWVVTMPIGDPPYYFDVPDCLAEKRFPTREELDSVSPDNPVYIRPIWGFWRHTQPLTSIANSKALEVAGITDDTPEPVDTVKFERDAETGKLNGIIHEWTFMPIVELGFFHMMPRFTKDDRIEGLVNAMKMHNATGTTSVLEEHGAAQELIQTYQAVNAAGRATVRAHLVFSPSWGVGQPDYAPLLQSWSGWLGHRGLGDDWLRVAGMYTEFGINEEALFRFNASPYTGWSGFNYDCGVPREKMKDFMVEAARNNIRISVISTAYLDILEEVNREVPIEDKRWIIGHLNIVTDDEAKRIADLGCVMTTHTNRYIYKQGHLTKEELGPNVENDIAPIRRLRDHGIHVGLATDNVPTTLFYPIWHVVSRYNLYTEESIAADQALSREDALRCATEEGAYLTFEEDVKGTLEPGKLADMVVLSDDFLTCPEDDIKDIAAEKTIVGGEVVYDRETDGDPLVAP